MDLLRSDDCRIDPLAPRLWGRRGPMDASTQENWIASVTPSSFSIGPDLREYSAMMVISAAAAFTTPLIIWVVQGWPRRFSVGGLVLGCVLAVPFVILAAIVWWASMRAWQAGLILQYDRENGLVTLARFQTSFPGPSVQRLELITGRWIKNYIRLTEELTELQVIIQRDHGRIIALPIVGTKSVPRQLSRVAHNLANAMQLPLTTIHDTTDYAKLLIAYRQRMCISCGYNLTGNVSGICPECGTPLPLIPQTPEQTQT
jgi:hypothetical protein